MINQLKRHLGAVLLTCSLGVAASEATPASNSIDLNCPSSSNCVNSLGEEGSLPALRFSGSPADAKARLLRTLAAFPEAQLVSHEALNIEVVFTTFLGFRDQVLFRINTTGQRIDFRSRSLVGRYDFGKNRARMQAFSARFESEPEQAKNN